MSTLEPDRDDVISKAAAMATSRRGGGGPPAESADQFIRQYYRHVQLEDLAERADIDIYGAAMSHYRLAGDRPRGTANVRAFTPTVAEHGWSAEGHTVVEVVTDDMSFLVDSVTMELNEQGRSVHMVVHPQLLVRRDVTGKMLEIIDNEGYAAGSEPDVGRESWIHVETDREDEVARDFDEEAVLAAIEEAAPALASSWRPMAERFAVIVAGVQAGLA